MISKRHITIINVILAILLVAAGGGLFWNIYHSRPAPVEEEAAPLVEALQTAPTPPPDSYYEIIVSRNLWREKFAAPAVQLPPTPPPPAVPPPQLRLVGTSVRRNPAKSSAIIEDVVQRVTKIYKTGDVVAGATVVEIKRNLVVLTHLGSEFIIRAFPDGIEVEPSRVNLDRILKKLGPNKWLVSKKGLWRYIGVNATGEVNVVRVLRKIMEALATVGCRPYYPSGRPRQGPSEGYEIVVLPKRHLATYLGIKQGDIIRKVNEQLIISKDSALIILQEAQDEDEITVEIQRGEELIKLEYMIQEEELETEGN